MKHCYGCSGHVRQYLRRFSPVRHEEGAAARGGKHWDYPRRAYPIGISLDRGSGARAAGQGIKRAPVGGERFGIEAETERRGGRGRKGDVSRP